MCSTKMEMDEKNDSRSWMRQMTLGCEQDERIWVKNRINTLGQEHETLNIKGDSRSKAQGFK